MFSRPRTSTFVPTMVRSSQSSKFECTLSAAIAQPLGANSNGLPITTNSVVVT
jgi:hypothetical protein